MSNITKRLETLKPHIIGIRYVQGVPVVDSMFKKGWHILKSPNVSFSKSDDQVGYYLFYGEGDDIGFDELLDHVERIINYNLEREAKHVLLIEKVDELKVLFKSNTLDVLKNLTFKLEKELIPEEPEDELDLDDSIPNLNLDEEPNDDEKKNEEPKIVQGVELPPKQKLSHKDGECLHEPHEYCDNCMHTIMEG